MSSTGTTSTSAAPAADVSKTSLLEVRLTAIRFAARDTHLYEFQRLDGAPLPPAQPGAHIGLHLSNGIERHYSLIEAQINPTRYTVGIKRDPRSRGGSRFIHDELRVGTVMFINPPRNNFPLAEQAELSILIAGGIGITPIHAMQKRLRELGRDWSLHYSCRSRSDAAFLDELQATNRTQFHFDEESGGKLLDLAAIVAGAPRNAHLYCCGPAPMLHAFEALTKDWPHAQIHVEYFTPKQEAARSGGFVVELARSGKQFTIPEGATILKVLRDNGINATSSCEEGVCAACETRVLSGIPDHRDSILSESERAANKTMMICCSGCKSDKLVLDL